MGSTDRTDGGRCERRANAHRERRSLRDACDYDDMRCDEGRKRCEMNAFVRARGAEDVKSNARRSRVAGTIGTIGTRRGIRVFRGMFGIARCVGVERDVERGMFESIGC